MDTTQPPFVRALVRVLAKAALAIAGLLDRRLDLGLALIVASVALDVIEEWTDRKPISDPKPTSDGQRVRRVRLARSSQLRCRRSGRPGARSSSGWRTFPRRTLRPAHPSKLIVPAAVSRSRMSDALRVHEAASRVVTINR